jgi:hypothetical protein
MELWRRLAEQNGLAGIYFVAICNSTTTVKRKEDGTIERVIPNLESSEEVYRNLLKLGFDGINSFGKSRAEMIYMGKKKKILRQLINKYLPILPPTRIDYSKAIPYFFAPEDTWENVFPTILPQWDRSPRANNSDGVYVNATPQFFKLHVEDALSVVASKQPDHQLLFLRSWNEWGEGNYVEPDLKFGHGFLDVLKQTVL